ncbi:glutamate receptor ionotropic, kainate 1-like [Penaeus vannamei]|uniref:glutamate receptor ionotropic, kainate 1-like n=1 Tax=Penaeus vannamei TaxID=6689 RepID=UPI00387F78E1
MGNLLKIFSILYNFDYELVKPPDGLWGARQNNGSWSGMMGMVHREEVEFAVGPFTITPERETVCDFSWPVHSDNLALIMVRPGLQNDVSGFLKPFSWVVWLLVLLSVVGVGAAMFAIERGEEKVFTFSEKNLLRKVTQWVLQTLTQESAEWLPRKDGGRLLVTTWLLASLVFMSSYSGILTAMLTVPRVTIPIDSLADLVAQDDLPWRLEAGSMMPKFLMESGDPVRQKVVTHSSGTFPDCWAARQAIARGEFAALCDETSMRKSMSWDFSTTGKCHLYIASQKVFTNAMMAMAFKTNSTYLPNINKVIRKVKESGLLERWMASQITNTSQCLRPPSSDRRDGIEALDFEAFSGPLLVLAAGESGCHRGWARHPFGPLEVGRREKWVWDLGSGILGHSGYTAVNSFGQYHAYVLNLCLRIMNTRTIAEESFSYLPICILIVMASFILEDSEKQCYLERSGYNFIILLGKQSLKMVIWSKTPGEIPDEERYCEVDF